ncbi:ABC transporter substrate-binding protein [Jeotgalibaca caeni]|uniref:ABC transporter substrate-binding protein n=1 Tax=Jeotgalibaca caeni TaxID=3028623 RepID=UPI00237D4944|nr:extracellular solute-binding protein [Jeotgalibaca caeni]MDE1549970.1 extracellular solute-binding protein [Jeotgalibaca caeni]
MKKKWKFLFLSLAALAMGACGNEGAADDTSEDVTSETSNEVAESATDDPYAQYPAIDMGGRTIKIATWWDFYYDSRHTDPTDNPGVNNTETAQMELDNIRRIEEKYNVKIEFSNLGWDGMTENINTSVVSGTPDYDIYTVDLQFGLAPAMNGYAMPVSEFAPDYSDITTDQTIMSPFETFGETYFFTETVLPTGGTYMLYNATMLDELGLEDPNELLASGEWTWEKFAEMTKATTRDTDGDGNIDVYGFGGVTTDTTNEFVASNGGSIATDLTEGLSSPETVEALEFIYNMYNVDKVAKPYTDNWDEQLLAWVDGGVAFAPVQAYNLINYGPELSYDYRIVKWPQGPSGDGTKAGEGIVNYYFIPKGTEQPEAVYQIFEEFRNWFAFDESYRDNYDWIETGFTNTEDLDLAMEIGEMGNGDLWKVADVNGAVGEATYNIFTGTMTVSQAVESYKQVLQDGLDGFQNKEE